MLTVPHTMGPGLCWDLKVVVSSKKKQKNKKNNNPIVEIAGSELVLDPFGAVVQGWA